MSIIGQLTTENERLALTFLLTAFAVPFFVGMLSLEYATVAGMFIIIGVAYLLYRLVYRGGKVARAKFSSEDSQAEIQ
jgi:hypothetical protein